MHHLSSLQDSSVQHFVASSSLPVSASDAFAYHERKGALEHLIPPWQDVKVESSDGSLTPGSIVVLKTKIGPKSIRWIAQHTTYEPPRLFVDVQQSGPFAAWEHRHEFDHLTDNHCTLRDKVQYELPFGKAGQTFGASFAKHQLESMFAYRHRVTIDDLELARRHDVPKMKIAISGASGLVGKRLSNFLRLIGHDVVRLERTAEKAQGSPDAIAPWGQGSEAEKLNGFDAVVHLAGKSIASGHWNEKVKQEIRDSRVELTTQLANLLAQLSSPPKVLVCASATGFYGDRDEETLTESSVAGEDFLASVAREWEAACQPAADAGIRVCNTRLGIVLDPRGGALQQMLLPAKMMGGHLGSGQQWWSWISLDDVVGGIYHAICTESLAGSINFSTPHPLRNREFAKTLGQVISRPALVPAPAFVLRLALGEMADALLLSSTKAIPKKLIESGYRFRFEHADDALRYCLGVDRMESDR
ncbi:TIGR01777 family oxidoreductase [Stieleria sp. JC731]|uniref:TIGR01777 family oxidoreductase n=1 Tax=Pirellulaceae TaxID=2691357 RepID=UPI001E2BD8A6|nr:TIGR01777 family oxidoreductase [Stieleria sp. JC731]MCC9602954.1 TIGR01777 family oxidoreductase [Stieleria sp. JC731]